VSGAPCDRFERLTAAGGDPEASPEFAAHAAGCEPCRRRRELWTRIAEAAPALQKRWDSPELYSRIERAIAPSDSRGAAGPAPRRLPFWARAAAAAAVAALVVISVIGVRVFREGAGREPLTARSRDPLLTESALSEVEQAESSYLASIDKLSRVARPKLDQDTSPLAAAYREKLLLLDSEIAEMRNEIERNQFNTHLRRELLAMYREKQRTLEDLMKGSSS